MSVLLVQGCYKYIHNKFELVLIASKRAKDISLKNSKLFVEPLKDKNTVISLREIESGYVDKFLDNN